MRIDKSKFTAEELQQYEALIAKAVIPEEEPKPDTPKPDDQPKGDEKKDTPEKPDETTQKSLTSPILTAALERLDKLEKTIEMNQAAEVAKKYSLLGENEEKLTETLYNLKKTDEPNYNAYIEVLDKSLELVQKSGLFTEIGKSGSRVAGGSVIDKINTAASEICKSDPGMSHAAAVAKAWESHPDLIEEYEAEYKVK